MTEISNVQSLSERLRKKLEKDMAEEALLKKEWLKKLESEFQKESRDVVTTTVNDIQSQINKDLKKSIQKNLRELQSEIKTLDSLTIKSWKMIFIAGLAVFLGLFIGSWGLTTYQSNKIKDQLTKIEGNRKKLKKLDAMGMEIVKDNKENRYLTIPKHLKLRALKDYEGKKIFIIERE